MAYFKASPEDFLVDEIALYPAIGSGPHTFVRIEKRLRTTEEVAEDLAQAFGLKRRDIGYAGRKDRVGVTRQWFSLPDIDPERVTTAVLPDAQVLEAVRHQNKLRTGHLRGNKFEMWVRGLTEAETEAAVARLETVKQLGFANRYGAQRFGRDGDNARRALVILHRGAAPKDRRRARFLLSALQAEVFNRVLDERPLEIGQLEVGDLAVKHESGGVFCVEDVEADNARARIFEISPTGPMFGTKVAQPLGAPAQREAKILTEYGVPNQQDLKAPRGVSLKGARRSLRVLPTEFAHQIDADAMKISVTLPSGSYATVLLEEVFGPLREGADVIPEGEGILA